MPDEIWVCADFESPGASCLIAKALKLGESLRAVSAAVCFSQAESRNKILKHGVDTVYLLETGGSDFVRSKQLADLAEKYKPQIILFQEDCLYSVIAARTAALLETGLTAGCRELYIDSDNLLRQVRPAYGGGIIAEIICEKARPQMATVNTDSLKAVSIGTGQGSIVHYTPSKHFDDPIDILKRELVLKKDDLGEAGIIIAGGRGIGSRAGFQLIAELAEKLGGAVGASRSAVDAGYSDYKTQIGQTGKNVSPDLYIALGISGSFQHIAGMNRSKKVIAVNRDPKAPIFDYADIAIVARWEDFVTGMLN